MTSIIQPNKYRSVASYILVTERTLPVMVTLTKGDDASLFKDMFLTISSASVDEKDRVTFQPTLGNDIYAYTLGKDPVTIQLQGFAFRTCKEEDSAKHGINELLRVFQEYRASSDPKNNVPLLTLKYGDHTYKVIWMGCSSVASSEETMDTFRFSLTFRGVRSSGN